jgi:hypothetical protein
MRWVSICAMTVVFLALAIYSAHGYPADYQSNGQVGNGTYLVQSEGEAPEICHSVSKMMRKALESDPEAKIFMLENAKGVKRLIVYLSDASSVLLTWQSGDLVCGGAILDPMQTIILQAKLEDPDSGVTITPVHPQQEE